MLLNSGGGTNLNWLNVLQGGFPGPIGATAVAVLLACLLYLFARHTASPLIALPYLLTCALIAALFPRAAVSAGTSVMLEMSAGVLLFSGVFFVTDPVTAPASLARQDPLWRIGRCLCDGAAPFRPL